MYRDGTLHDDVDVEHTGMGHYIMMWMWNVEGQSIMYTVHWRAGYEEKKFAAVIPVLSASNNVPKPKNIDFQIST